MRRASARSVRTGRAVAAPAESAELTALEHLVRVTLTLAVLAGGSALFATQIHAMFR